MKLAIIHYHLKPGGVTSVIRQQLKALSGECDVLLLTGELPDTPVYGNTKLIPGLGYTGGSPAAYNPEETADMVVKTIFETFNGKCDIIHVHNPLLAKNIHFLRMLKTLQKKGCRLFLQIHDFAEDGRPSAYYRDESYIANCHYGVINSRDYSVLNQSGLTPEGLHLLPNTVTPIHVSSAKRQQLNRILYPVRAIRRKNIGEAILLSLFFENHTLSITLPPNSPSDMIIYNGWKRFVSKNNLHVEFEAGLKNDFNVLVSSSDFFLTTSIMEGFGFSFLEPWTASKMLWGRAIPEICNDFINNGGK